MCLCIASLAPCSKLYSDDIVVFPAKQWDHKPSSEFGLDDQKLDAVATVLGSRGCVIKNGYVVKAWGAQSDKGDWASSAKPVLSTLLMFAHHEGRVKSFDQPIVDFGWDLLPKDRAITFRHLASMTSGYARPEAPGAAWAYNDYAIQLYQMTLFDKVYHDAPEHVFHAPERFGVLQLEDGFEFRKTNRRMRASVRDFARVAWFWMNRGQWNGRQVLPREYFDQNMRPQVPADLPLSVPAATDDYLKIGTYGGDSNHYSDSGPGIYGFNWWFNNQVGTRVGTLTWPDAPPDTVMALGVRGNCVAMIPSLNLLVVAANADWGKNDAGDPQSVLNQRLKLIADAGTVKNGKKEAVIDTSGFRDSASHWRQLRDNTRFIQVEPDQPVYAPDQVHEIVENILLFQRSNGGWPKDYDMLAVLSAAQKEIVLATRDRTDTSFDNHNGHSQVHYLAQAYSQSGTTSWRDACLRGLDFLLAAQLPNGGFPQRYPNTSNYGGYVTFNDGVMIGVLNVLQDAAERQPHWNWLDDDNRQKAASAVSRGIACILNCQIQVENIRTGWCQQHDPKTFAAAPARTFELASICPQDTTEIIRFLMRIENPSPDIVSAMDDSIRWLDSVALTGIRLERVRAPKVEFLRHDSDFDIVVQSDPTANRIWARHYEIGTNRPVFAGRDAVKRYSLSEIERERRTGTAWYGTWPTRLLKAYPEWRASVK